MGAPPWFRERCDALLTPLRSAGWEVAAEQAIPYGRLYRLAYGASQATLSCYHGKKGFRHVVGGKAAGAVRALLGDASPTDAPASSATGDDPFGAGVPRIGADESGKGDYFGPLVVAAFYMDAETLDAVGRLGVRDSKQLSRGPTLRMAGALDRLDRGAVRVLSPADYGAAHRRTGNANLVLAEEHGACISALCRRAEQERWPAPRSIVVDRFSTRTGPLMGAIRKPAATRLIAEPKGEADAAVACASILARAAFLEALDALGQTYGMTLPPGAGAPVLKAGREFVKTFGRDQLNEVAKVHFATTEQIG